MGGTDGDAIDLTDDTLLPSAIALSDSDDEDLKKAIALSLQSMPKEPVSNPELTVSTYGIPGIDRRQQERERLARLKRKRDAEVSPPPVNRTSTAFPSKAASIATAPNTSPTVQPSQNVSKVDTMDSVDAFPYVDGVVKKTWAFGYPRAQDVKLEEILQRSTLQAAVLSSFQWDMEWLFGKLDTARTKFVLVMQAKGQAVQEQYLEETRSMPNLRLCFPPMDGQINCMHSKLMLLFHPTHLRIVTPTANLVPYDWGEAGGFMENMLFAIDLPSQKGASQDQATPFKEELTSFLKAQGMYKDVLDKLQLFDFSRTRDYAFVHTIGGSHHQPRLQSTGICGLGKSVKALGLDTTNGIEIDYITSSVGSLSDDFLRSVYQAAQGNDGQSTMSTQRSKSSRKDVEESKSDSDWKGHFRCYFPSDDTVQRSKSGPAGAGTVCFQKDWWNKATFPREIMHDCISSRPGMLMHNKVMCVRPQQHGQAAIGSRGPFWAYLGSANLSESAWGKIVHDRSTKAPKLNCRNWECGVLIPLKKAMDDQNTQTGLTDDLAQIGCGFPLPIQLPAQKLATKKPWFFMSR